MKYYFTMLDDGTLVIDLVERMTERKYGNNMEYIKNRNTRVFWCKHYFETYSTTSGVWNWKTVKYHSFSTKVSYSFETLNNLLK